MSVLLCLEKFRNYHDMIFSYMIERELYKNVNEFINLLLSFSLGIGTNSLIIQFEILFTSDNIT